MIHRNDVPLFASLVTVVLLVLLLMVLGVAWTRTVPACQEDSVLVGVGSFDRGRWSRYECGPAVDDLVQCVVESWDAAGVHVEWTPVPCG